MHTLKTILNGIIGFFLFIICFVGVGLYLAFVYCLACIIVIGAVLLPYIPFLLIIWLISLMF